MINPIKIALSILLFGCLLPMPYGYYQLVRFISMAGFAYLAYLANERHHKNEVFVFIALALLFQLFIKIVLGRTLWNVVDVIVSIGLIVSVYNSKKVKDDFKNDF